MIKLTINGKEILLEKPTTVLEAARGAGIDIPTLCNHEVLEAYGGCRLCLVEVEKMPKLQPACMLQAADGMVVRTETEAVVANRRGILELLLINHPLDCPHCDKAGECELQDVVSRHGPRESRFGETKREAPESFADPLIARNMERCILCTRCIRMCAHVQGAFAISVMDRGGHSTVEAFSPNRFDCEYCGNCISACPVGALLSRVSLHSYRPWALDREVVTVCPYCGVGCSFVTQIRDESITRVMPRFGLGHNNGLLCGRGRFGYEFVGSPDRIQEPLVRKGDSLQKATWEEALDLIAKKLVAIRDASGGEAIAGIGSPRCTNEDNYVFQKFLREVCRTDHIDSVSRLGFAASQRYLEELLGRGATANGIPELAGCDPILVLGGDPTAVNPILGLSIRKAARSGANVVVLGSAPGLERFRSLHVTPLLFREADVLEAVASRIYKAKGARGANAALDKIIAQLSERPAPPDLRAPDVDALAEVFLKGKSPAIVTGMDVVQRKDGHRALFAVAALTYLLGAKLYLLSERANEQGLLDMGCAPANGGLTLLEMMEAIRSRRVRALYVMGENPAFNLPGAAAVREALAQLDLLVVQDIFLSETARLAHVVLPATAWSEKEGTYTNLESRVQLVRRAVRPRFGMDDWKIVSRISEKMGRPLGYASADAVFREIAETRAPYRGLSHVGIAGGVRLSPSDSRSERVPELVADPPSRDYPAECYIGVDRPLLHCGTLTRRSPAIQSVAAEPEIKIGPALAERLGFRHGDTGKLSVGDRSLTARVAVVKGIEDRRALLSNHFEDRGAFSLMDYRLDEVTKAPGLEGIVANLERVAR